jgi:carboxylesterase
LARDHERVGEKGRTIAHLHGERRPRAVVLLHGMSASPTQFDRFARDLHSRGHNVLVPRLPHHGHADRLSTGLARLRPDELYAGAGEYLAIASELGERVTVAGFSLGGLVAAWTAQHHEVDRAVAIAPFFGVAWIPGSMMSGVAELLLKIPNQFHWWDPILRERQMPEHGYPRFSTHAIAHAYGIAHRLLGEARATAPRANKIALVTNRMESAVNNRAILRLYRSWRRHKPDDVTLSVLRGLPPSHDVVEPLRKSNLADRVYPHLLDVIDPQ